MTVRTKDILLYTITWVTDTALALMIFGVTRDLAERGYGSFTLGLIGGLFFLIASAAGVISGHVSDRVGRRRVIVTGILLALATYLTCRLAEPGGWVYMTAFVLSGVCGSTIYPALIAWLNQGHGDDRRGRVVSARIIRFCVAWNLGVLAGSLGGGWLYTIDPRWPLTAAIILAGVDLALVAMTGWRPSRPAAPTRAVTPAVDVERQRAVAFAGISWVANLGGTLAMSMVLYLFPKLAIELGIDPDKHGTMLATIRVFTISTYFLMHRSTFWRYRLSASLTAQAIAVVGLLLLATASHASILMFALACVGVLLGYNYFAGIVYSTASRTDERKGFAAGMHEATLALGFGVGSIGGGLIAEYAGLRAPYVLAMTLIAILAAVQIAIYLRHAPAPRETSS